MTNLNNFNPMFLKITNSVSKVVEQSTSDRKIKGLNPASRHSALRETGGVYIHRSSLFHSLTNKIDCTN
jgi:hypothetical protein